MTKREAIALFGTTASQLARALGVTPQYISRWPDELTERQADWVRGAAVRLGKLPETKRQVA